MAITPTGAIFKTLSFDGESLRSYGVYISGEATFNAPAREVEMISIPGRSGQLALDKGRFENIEVTYPAGIYADTEEDFAEAVSELRNFLCSRSGYCRIEDDYNPNEFRMGIYKSGLEVTPALLKAGEFDLVFDCKPQRWLKSGEDEIEVQDGDTITNPTLFESSPLLEVEGYGALTVNGSEIKLTNDLLGVYTIREAVSYSINPYISDNCYIGNYYANIGDKVSVGATTITIYLKASAVDYKSIIIDSVPTISGFTGATVSAYLADSLTLAISIKLPKVDFALGGNYSATADTHTDIRLVKNDDTTVSGSVRYLAMINNGSGSRSISISNGLQLNGAISFGSWNSEIKGASIVVDSTQTLLGHPTYIDCDLGEAYKVESGQVISLNAHIDLGSDLPTLASGANTVTFGNTITDLKVVPRWWKI